MALSSTTLRSPPPQIPLSYRIW